MGHDVLPLREGHSQTVQLQHAAGEANPSSTELALFPLQWYTHTTRLGAPAAQAGQGWPGPTTRLSALQEGSVRTCLLA